MEHPPTKRLNYFDHQFLRADDFADEQAYHLGMRRAHNRLLHTPGVAQGLAVRPEGNTARVTAGVALDGDGREIVLVNDSELQVPGEYAGKTVYVTIAYAEQQTDATRETGAEGYRRCEEVPRVNLAPDAPPDPAIELVLGRLTIDNKRNVTGMDDGEGDARRRVAGPRGMGLEVASLTVERDVRAGGRIYDAAGIVFPPGGIIMWSGSVGEIPPGWALCDGQNGTPDLRGRFVVGWNPADRDYSTVGATGGKTQVALTVEQIPSHSHPGKTLHEQAHRHVTEGTHGGGGEERKRKYPGASTVYLEYSHPGNPDPQTVMERGEVATNEGGAHSHEVITNPIGGNQPHENRPPYYVLAYIMKR